MTFRTRGSSATCCASSCQARFWRLIAKRWRRFGVTRGSSLDDDAAFLLLCRQTLAGNRDPGRSSYQIALTVCERCRRATQQGRGELIEVGPEIVEMAECDAQHIGHVDAHVGVRCDAGARVHLDVDDLERRCEGGKHLVANLLTLCGAHHRAAHDGSLIITGTPASGLFFAHADGTPYGGAVRPAVADARAKAFQALVGMGFRESEAKRALGRIPHAVSSLEQVIRQALRELAHR